MFKKLNRNFTFIIVLLFSFVVLDQFTGLILSHFYFSDAAKRNDQLVYGIFESRDEIMTFGSSRAQHHYNPAVITKETGMTCFNMGYGGQNIYFHKALLQSILIRYQPKLIILELMNIDIEKTAPSHDREKLGVLLPFYKKSRWLREAVLFRGESEKYKTLSGIYPFNSTIYQIYRNNWWPMNNHINGYIPIRKVWNREIQTTSEKAFMPDSSKIAALFDFIRLTQDRGCKILIAISPHFVRKSGISGKEQIVSAIRENYGLEALNLEQDSSFLANPSYFADPFHLNDKGAELYSAIIAQKVKEIITKGH